MTLAYIYKWTQLSTGKWYIGSRSAEGCNPKKHEKYICSSKIVKPMILTNRSDWFYEILETSEDKGYIRKLETKILIELDAKNNPTSYNNSNAIFDPGNRLGRKETIETKLKKSLARKGEKNPMYGKRGNKSPHYGKKYSIEHRSKQSIALKRYNKNRPIEHNQNISRALKGNPKLVGRMLAEKNPMFGKSASDHSKMMSKLKNSGSNNPMRKPEHQRYCEWCHNTIAKNHYTMYHGDRCKSNPSRE